MFSAIGLYIAVIINGEVWEAVPAVFPTVQGCLDAQKLYTKDIVLESGCYKGTFKLKG